MSNSVMTSERRDEDVSPQPRARGAPAIGVFLVFVIAGPPLGLLSLLAAGTLLAPAGSFGGTIRVPTAHELDLMLKGFGLFSPFSYLFGGVQAACVGLVAAIAQYHDRVRRVPLIPMLVASFVAGAAFLGIIALKSPQPPTFTAIAGFLALHCAAGIGCWLVANALLWPFRPRHMPAAAT